MSVAPTLLRRRWRPRTLAGKAGVVGVAALVLVVVLWVIAFVATERRLARAEARCAALGMSRSWEERVGPLIADEENAAVALEEAIEYVEPRLLKAIAGPPGGLPLSSQEGFKTLAAELVNDSWLDRLVGEVDARRGYRTKRAYANEPVWSVETGRSISRMIYVNRLEPLIGRRLAAKGQRREAVERLLRLLRITCKSSDREPSLGTTTMGLEARVLSLDALNDILRDGRLPAECYAAIENEVQLLDAAPMEMVRAIDADRYFQIRANRNSWWGRSELMRPFANLDRAYVHEAAANYVDLIGVPYAEAVGRLTPAHPLGHPQFRYQLSTFYAYEQLVGLRRAADMVVARARCLRVVNAMAKWNDFSAAIETLGLPAESLIDPFDGKRLRVRETKHGPVVYSIGHDLVDDGGQPQASNGKGDVALGPFETAEAK